MPAAFIANTGAAESLEATGFYGGATIVGTRLYLVENLDHPLGSPGGAWGLFLVGNTTDGITASTEHENLVAWTADGYGYSDFPEYTMSGGSQVAGVGNGLAWVVTLDGAGDFVSEDKFTYPEADMFGFDGYNLAAGNYPFDVGTYVVDSGPRSLLRMGMRHNPEDGGGQRNGTISIESGTPIVADVDDSGATINRGGPAYDGYVYSQVSD